MPCGLKIKAMISQVTNFSNAEKKHVEKNSGSKGIQTCAWDHWSILQIISQKNL